MLVGRRIFMKHFGFIEPFIILSHLIPCRSSLSCRGFWSVLMPEGLGSPHKFPGGSGASTFEQHHITGLGVRLWSCTSPITCWPQSGMQLLTLSLGFLVFEMGVMRTHRPHAQARKTKFIECLAQQAIHHAGWAKLCSYITVSVGHSAVQNQEEFQSYTPLFLFHGFRFPFVSPPFSLTPSFLLWKTDTHPKHELNRRALRI